MKGMRSQDCWSELRHTWSRIVAYSQSFKAILRAQEMWPQLFKKFNVYIIPSSKPLKAPRRKSSLRAENIVGRMTSERDKIEKFRDFVQKLQLFSLDERIQDAYGKSSFRPIVHSEILIHNWLETNGGLESERFFNGWKYIGSSKPTCRLCHYYLVEHGSDIDHRATHSNLYLSWRLPDVFKWQGEAGEKSRQMMADRVLKRVRKDAFDLVWERAAPRFRVHDSNTSSASITLGGGWTLGDETGTHVDEDDLASLVGGIDLNSE